MKSFRKSWLMALPLAALVSLAPVWAAEPDPYLPAKAEVVVFVNVRQIMDSAVVKKFALEEMKKGLAKEEKAQEFMKATGLDPLKDIDSVMITNIGGVEKGQFLAVVRGKFDQTKIHTAAKEFAKKEKEKLAILDKVDGVQLYELKSEKQGDLKSEKQGDKPMYAAFADDKTIVATQSKEETVKTVKNGKKPAAQSDMMKAALSKLSGKESLWMVGVITDEMKAPLKKSKETAGVAEKLQMITGSVNLTDGAQANVQILATDAEGVKQVKMFVNQFVQVAKFMVQGNEQIPPAAAEMLGNLKVTSDATSVSVGIKITPDMLEKLNKKEQ